MTRGPASSRPGLARERGAGRQRLDAPSVGAVALARGPVHVDHDVTELPGRADAAAIELAPEDQPTADPGPDRQQHDLAGAPRGARPMLRQRRHVAVVIDEYG